MSHPVCHAHCPPEAAGGALLAAAVMAAVAVWAVLGDILWAAGIILAVAIAGGLVLLWWALRRGRVLVPARQPFRHEVPLLADRPGVLAVPARRAAVGAPPVVRAEIISRRDEVER